ncbi:MAG: 3-ketoacyl-CoA thiolase [Pseudomonadota bacterium]
MTTLGRKIYAAAGYNTVCFGSGRKEFNPKKPMPTFEAYLKETAEGTAQQVSTPEFDEGIISNFMAGRFIKQGNLAGFLPYMMPSLSGKPCLRVEGACGSGGLALTSGIKTVLSGVAETVFVAGFEIQNTQKAVYGADVLAGAAYYNGERKEGHAFFFPGIFSNRAGSYYQKYDQSLARQGMAKWYELAILNARKTPKAQEYHNNSPDLFNLGMSAPTPKSFVEHLNFYDCSKVSDGASSIIIASESGLKKLGLKKEKCIEIVGFAGAENDITLAPQDPTTLATTGLAAQKALQCSGLTKSQIGYLELHDCFTITGLLALESIGVAEAGKAAQFILDGKTTNEGTLPVNLSGGLVGFGHPTGATGVRQLVDILHQLTGQADNQAKIKKDYAMMISMGGNDKTVTAIIAKKA